MSIRSCLPLLVALALAAVSLRPAFAAEPTAAGRSLQLHVIPGDWGDAPVDDIRAVCLSAAGELARHFPDRQFDPMSIRYSTRGPMVIFGHGAEGERRVLLNVQGTYWAQFAFQFAHEFGHIACNYREADNPNLWFEESLCELASLFALRRMSETWRTDAPYRNWRSFAPHLARYADDRLEKARLPDDRSLADWYREHAAALRSNAHDRDKNLVVAAALLPLFEEQPQRWPALSHLNQWDKNQSLSFPEYLLDWRRRAAAEQQPLVDGIAGLFEIPLE